MGHHLSVTLRTAALFAVVAIILAFGSGSSAWAQPRICPGHAACVGGTYNPADGYCYSGAQPFTNAMDHWQATCADGEMLDRASGICRPSSCGGSGLSCREAAVCPSGTTYTGASSGQGVCEHRGDFGSVDHQLVPCSSGWTLDTSRGICRYCLALHVTGSSPIILLPDLTFKAAWLAAPDGATMKSIRRGRPYLACFIVANVGSAASGVFRVSGGGLGVATNPYQDQAGLAPGASRQGCLSYPTTPAPGSYQLGITADSQNVVHELREDNNDAGIRVVVVP